MNDFSRIESQGQGQEGLTLLAQLTAL